MSRAVRTIGRGLAWLGAVLIAACLVEGLASLATVAGAIATRPQRPLAEREYTRYDAELGWVARPHVALVDLYGPGASLHTNARGFRGTREVAPDAPPGVVRIVCSGDSFALGYGVGDDDTWCQQLSVLAPAIESVNMGQGGYGLDQAYLWFLRDGAPLAHHVHLFTFIGEDFARMGVRSFFGYGKPILVLDGAELEVGNVPVPRAAYFAPWLAQNLRFANQLRSVQIGRALLQRVTGTRRVSQAELARLASAVFTELAALHRAAGRRLVLVHLPMREEYRDDSTASLRAFVANQARRLGVPFLDGTVALRRLPSEEIATLYLDPRAIDLPAAAGHFTVRGNRWVAQWILTELRQRGVLAPP